MNVLIRKSRFELGLLAVYQKNKHLQERFQLLDFIRKFSVIQSRSIPAFPAANSDIEEGLLHHIQCLYTECFSDFGKDDHRFQL